MSKMTCDRCGDAIDSSKTYYAGVPGKHPWQNVCVPCHKVYTDAGTPPGIKKNAPALNAEQVNHPAHYNAGRFEVIDVIEDWRLDFHLGNVVKYVARAPHKGSELTDLKKARWYLNRRIELLGGRCE